MPRDAVDKHLRRLDAPLADLIAALNAKLPPEDGAIPVAVDAETLSAVCRRLLALLAEDDAEAEDVIEENANLLNSAFPDDFCRLHAAIKDFNFDVAMVALNEAMARPHHPA